MKDLTNIITNIIRVYDGDWIFNDFFTILSILKKSGFEISFWKEEENWASVIHNSKVVGFLWSKYPLLFIENKYKNLIKKKSNNYKFEIIFVDSISTDLFKIDNNLVSMFDFFINSNSFTAEDLWFNSNSK